MTKTKKIILIIGLVIIALDLSFIINLFFGIESPYTLGPNWSVHKYVPSYNVYRGEKLIAVIKPESGLIVSTATPPPPPGQQIKHPFLTATALVPEEENNLYQLLQKAKNFDDYVNLLKANGYTISITHI
jgi:hypothetical protein